MERDNLSLEEALESGDPDAINALLEAAEFDGDLDDLNRDDLVIAEVDVAGAAGNASSDTATAGDAVAQTLIDNASGSEEEPGESVLMSRDGKHQIPYAVLEGTRESLSAAKQENQDLASKTSTLEAQLTETQRLLELRNTQLEDNNIAPKVPPEDMVLDDEAKKTLIEEYGDLGEMLVAQQAQLQALRSQSTQAPATQAHTPAPAVSEADAQGDQVMAAIAANPDLEAWRTGDDDRWQFVVSVDQALRKDPTFSTKSYGERFAEAARRTKAAFGDPASSPGSDAAAQAQAVIDAASPSVPSSLTDIGAAGADADQSPASRLADMSPEDIADAMEGMSEQQIEALLLSAG